MKKLINVYAYIAETQQLSPVSAASLIYTEPQTEVKPDKLDILMSTEEFWLNFKAELRSVELRRQEFIPSLLERTREIYEEINPPKGREGCKDCQKLNQLLTTIPFP